MTGASFGIGQQCAITCSQMRAKVVLMARNEQRLAATLLQMEGEEHLPVSFELTDFAGIKEEMRKIVSEVGPIYGLVNCAGISTTLPLKLMDVQKMDEFFHINVFSAIELTRHFCQL